MNIEPKIWWFLELSSLNRKVCIGKEWWCAKNSPASSSICWFVSLFSNWECWEWSELNKGNSFFSFGICPRTRRYSELKCRSSTSDLLIQFNIDWHVFNFRMFSFAERDGDGSYPYIQSNSSLWKTRWEAALACKFSITFPSSSLVVQLLKHKINSYSKL